MTIPGLSEATIRAHASPDSYSRGASYYQRGAVGELALRGDTLQAEVEGSQYTPYRVRISFDAGGVTDADCTCPYDWGGWCKHIVAALLKCAAEPDAIERRPPLDELLNELDRSQLLALLVALADLDPDTADEIERRAGLMRLASAAPATAETVQPRPAGAPTRRAPIDQAAIRQQIRLALRPARRGRYDYDYYDDEDPGGEIVEAVRPLLGQARGFIDGGDARSALAVLEALTDEYIDGCRALGEDFEESYGISIGESSAGEFFGELAEAWAEAVLGADLDDEERDEWGELLAGWRDDADDFGAGMAMDLAVTAADQGWDYPPLQRVFQGEITERGAWEGERPDYADELALARLRILERQGRSQDYLYLAEAEGQLTLYVTMLAKIGRTQEAVEEGLKYLVTPNEALQVARALRERGELESALRIAEHGLALQPPASDGYSAYATEHGKAELADWAADLAAGMGDRERAQRAAEIAFRAAPSLNAYLKAQELAGAGWADLRPGLLDYLRQSKAYIADAKVNVFLHENLIDDAIAAVKDGSSYGLLERVMDAALATRPDWVIKAATAQAERIMDAGKAQQYDYAVGWLRRARDAYRAAGRDAEWRSYLAGVRTLHGRKYKLMGLLAQL